MQRWTAFAEFSSRRLTSYVARTGVRFKPLASARTNAPTGSLLRVHSGSCAIMAKTAQRNPSDCRGADQARVHLGLGSLVERNPLLLERGLSRAPARMAAGVTDERRQRPC